MDSHLWCAYLVFVTVNRVKCFSRNVMHRAGYCTQLMEYETFEMTQYTKVKLRGTAKILLLNTISDLSLKSECSMQLSAGP